MPSGRKIIDAAVRMSLADLSVLLSALRAARQDEALLVTIQGSENDRFWGLLAEKGWLTRTANSGGDLPASMAAYAFVPEFQRNIMSVAMVCFEGLRQGMSPEEIIAVGEGASDERLAHLF